MPRLVKRNLPEFKLPLPCGEAHVKFISATKAEVIMGRDPLSEDRDQLEPIVIDCRSYLAR